MKYPPITPRMPHMLHGGDYNPDQWQHDPGVLEEDVRLMKLAGCNAMSVGIFAWSALEPEEGRFAFGWLDEVMARLWKAGIGVILATPSGARPAWMSKRYREVLRVGPDRVRILHGRRHNHCYTSPVYRGKVEIINRKLAERYGEHQGLLMWHLSNEYGGECHCDLCQAAFREWLRERYRGDLDRLNRAWWAAFWSHTYNDWAQVEPPAPHGEQLVHAQNLDWRRFVSHQTVDFMRQEIGALREHSPDVPVTTNMMGTYPVVDYWRFAEHLDVISWDSYPCWHGIGEVPDGRGNWDRQGRDWRLASDIGFVHDINRSLKAGRPFMLMESTPSVTNWSAVAKLKRPGMHLLSSLQAVAHGSDTVQYFQWRKSRGSSEKFHGAVVDHEGSENTRVFGDVAAVGAALGKLDAVVGAATPAQAALIYDWENRWALEDAKGPRNDGLTAYEETCKRHYYPLWKRAIATDVINADRPVDGYGLVVAPMLYMLRAGVAERLGAFVKAGGTLITTYLTGIADESDLCFLGGFPGPLKEVLGIWAEEIDALYPQERNAVVMADGNELGMKGEYEARHFCDLVHLRGAEALATYGGDFYAGRPALTVNRYGKGRAYTICSRNDDAFLDAFYGAVTGGLGLERALAAELPEGVTARARTDGERDFVFVMNFAPVAREVDLGDRPLTDLLDGGKAAGRTTLPPYGVRVLERRR